MPAAMALLKLLRDARRPGSALAPVIRARLRKVLLAAASVPHYREQMRQAGYDPARDYSGPADLSILAVTRKADLKASPLDFVQAAKRDRLAQYFSDCTSGSTGIPLTVYRAPRERAVQIAKWLRVLMLNGYRPTDKMLSYTSPGRLGEGRSPLQRFGLLRRMPVDYTLPLATLADALLAYRPDVVYGVRTSLLQVAEELKRRGVQAPPLKLLVAGGEVIDAQTRQRCREAFGVDITETYGTVEMGVMAWQQRGQDGLHLIEDCTWFEFLDEQGNPAGPGQPARVVVTDLRGGLMPFIRYEQGDLATYSLRQNAHGETVRVIDRVIGRQDDLAYLPDGSFLTFLDFYGLHYGYDGLQHMRVTQCAPLSFLVEVVADPDYFQSIRQDLAQRLGQVSKLPLAFDLKRVERIAPDPGGKLRMLISTIGKP